MHGPFKFLDTSICGSPLEHGCDLEGSNECSLIQALLLCYRHAGIYTAEEVALIARDKLIRLQSLYIDQFKRLQHLMKEKRRRYLHHVKQERDAFGELSCGIGIIVH